LLLFLSVIGIRPPSVKRFTVPVTIVSKNTANAILIAGQNRTEPLVPILTHRSILPDKPELWRLSNSWHNRQ